MFFFKLPPIKKLYYNDYRLILRNSGYVIQQLFMYDDDMADPEWEDKESCTSEEEAKKRFEEYKEKKRQKFSIIEVA